MYELHPPPLYTNGTTLLTPKIVHFFTFTATKNSSKTGFDLTPPIPLWHPTPPLPPHSRRLPQDLGIGWSSLLSHNNPPSLHDDKSRILFFASNHFIHLLSYFTNDYNNTLASLISSKGSFRYIAPKSA